MAGKQKRDRSTFWLYLIIVMCLITSGIAAWGALSKLQHHEESADAYHELQQEVLVQQEQTVSPEEAFAPVEVDAHGLEDQEADQEETLRMIQQDKPSLQFFSDPGEGEPEQTLAQTAPPTPQPTRGIVGAAAGASASPAGTPTASAAQTWAPTASPTALSAVPSEGLQAVFSLDADLSLSAMKEQETVPPTINATPTVTSKPTPSPTPSVTPTPTPTPVPTPVPTEEPEWRRYVDMDQVRYTVNFPYLKSLYPDVVAWLLQENTTINYPVLQGEDNDTYLDRMFDGRSSDDGSLFMDSANSPYFISANTYIYGHNTKVGSMFASLSNYASQTYFEEHPRFILLTPYADFSVDVFACTFSLVEDESSWRVRQFSKKADFETYIKYLKERSFIKTEMRPEWGDQLLVLVTCTNVKHGQRYVVYGRMRPIRYGTQDTITLTKMNIDARETFNGRFSVGNLGQLMVYGQNDPLWNGLLFEGRSGNRKRPFGDGGAGPTAVAMAVANLVPPDKLTRIGGYSNVSAGYTFCTCSVNQYFCNRKHAQYQVQTPEEYVRYLPMVMASFATGNNLWELESRSGKGGTDMRFVEYVAGIYGLTLSPSLELQDALDVLARQGMVVCATGTGSPFAKGSHYVVLAGMDDQYLYILDPFRRGDYHDTDKAGLLELVAPNVVRTPLHNANGLGLSAFFGLEKGS